MMFYLYRGGPRPVSISRIIDVEKHMDLIANSVIYHAGPCARLLVAEVPRGRRRLRLRAGRLRPR